MSLADQFQFLRKQDLNEERLSERQTQWDKVSASTHKLALIHVQASLAVLKRA